MGRLLAKAGGAVLGAAAGWTLYSRFAVNHEVHLPPAVDAERRRLHSAKAGELNYYADESGQGAPLVLIHSVNAAASAYEMRPLFHHFQGRRPVFALDLPGFGFSERGDRVYSAEMYVEAILNFVEAAAGREPADVVALSLGSEFVARAALQRPDLFRSLALISPTGFDPRTGSGGSERARRAFSFPLWSQAFYDLLTSPPSIEYYLRKSFAGPVDTGLAEYDYASSHQPGARFAPLYFISGKLFTPNAAAELYARLEMPVEVLYDRDGYITFDLLPEFLRRHSNWRAVRIPGTQGLPHFEQPGQTLSALEEFWTHAAAGALKM